MQSFDHLSWIRFIEFMELIRLMTSVEDSEKRAKIFKIVIIGDGGVGKTSLRSRFFGEGFKSQYMMTIGADFAVKREAIDDQEYILHFWDVAGQPRFKDVRSSYYDNCMGIIVVFDLTIHHTFENIPQWVAEVSESFKGDIREVPLILIGNKMDLRGEPGIDLVPTVEASNYAKELSKWSNHEVKYFETSALVGLNVDSAFKSLIKSLP